MSPWRAAIRRLRRAPHSLEERALRSELAIFAGNACRSCQPEALEVRFENEWLLKQVRTLALPVNSRMPSFSFRYRTDDRDPGNQPVRKPEVLRCDNGSEFSSRHLLVWCEENGITSQHIQPARLLPVRLQCLYVAQIAHAERSRGKILLHLQGLEASQCVLARRKESPGLRRRRTLRMQALQRGAPQDAIGGEEAIA